MDAIYYKPQDEEILEKYLKAVDFLIINNEHRLQKQLYHYKRKSKEVQDIRQQLEKNYEANIESVKIEMENKFKQHFEKINISKLD